MSFNIQRLVNSRAVISGSDLSGVEGQLVVSTTQWDEIKLRQGHDEAQATFDEAVEKFFAPILEAAEKAEAAVQPPADDPLTYVTLVEGNEGVAPVTEQRVRLSHDSQLLRLVELGRTDRLIWVKAGDHVTLEILDVDQAAVTAVKAEIPEATEVVDEPVVSATQDSTGENA